MKKKFTWSLYNLTQATPKEVEYLKNIFAFFYATVIGYSYFETDDFHAFLVTLGCGFIDRVILSGFAVEEKK